MIKTKLRTKLLLTGVVLTAAPLITVSAVVFFQNQKMTASTILHSTELAHADLNHIAESVYHLVESHQEVNEKNLKSYLNVARELSAAKGGFALADETVEWKAVNQFNENAVSIQLPKMTLGEEWLGRVSDSKTPVALVDQVQSLTGVTCTVFQRMNEAGDMLRVATNVIRKDGTRAIGTYIPRTDPGGVANPVVTAVLEGETYLGRAYVVNGWYIAAYEPIHDAHRNVIGMLYVGIPQESTAALRHAIMDIKVGKTGYVFVLDSKGHYVISHQGKRDGEDISQVRDSNGSFFIQEMVKKALALNPEATGEHIYPWKNPEDAEPRSKIVKLMYFKPWDWIIGVGMYEDELMDAVSEVRNLGEMSNKIILGLLGLSILGTVLTWWLAARGISRPVIQAIDELTEGASQVSTAADQISGSSQSLAEGSSEQAASIEETSSALEEMSSMTRQNADNAGAAAGLMKEVHQVVTNADESMRQLAESMGRISKASEDTQRIVKTIDEIAFQTNLLALNAAVEAARAGEAGAGFAVVADEVRNLAMRAAEAARNTAGLIEETVKTVKVGSDLTGSTKQEFTQVSSSMSKMGELVAEISEASQEQAQGIEQINRAVSEMDKVVQRNAASAEESASASEEMRAQAEQMKSSVGQLAVLVHGAAVAGGMPAAAGRGPSARDVSRASDQEVRPFKAPAPRATAARRSLSGPHASNGEAGTRVPSRVMPFEDGDLKDF